MVSSFVKSPSQSAYNKSEGNDFLGSRYEVRGAAFSLVTRDSSLVIGCVVKSVGKVFCNTARLACHHHKKLRVSAALSELRITNDELRMGGALRLVTNYYLLLTSGCRVEIRN